MWQQGQTLDGGYTVTADLGGDEWTSTLKISAADGQDRVLRVLHAAREPARGRFHTAAERLCDAPHGNLVNVLEVLTVEGFPAALCEYIGNCDLRVWMGPSVRELGAVLPVFRGIVRGVAAGHALGLVHGNLRASKVMVTLTGHAKVADFALGTLVEDGALPETDLAHLGPLLGHLLTGDPTHLTGQQLWEDTPQAVVALLRDLSAPGSAQFPSSADALLDRLAEDPGLAVLMIDDPRRGRTPIAPPRMAALPPAFRRTDFTTGENTLPTPDASTDRQRADPVWWLLFLAALGAGLALLAVLLVSVL